MNYGSTGTIGVSTTRTLFAIIAIISLAFSALAIAAPALASHEADTRVDLHQSTPIASDDEAFAGSEEDCRAVADGSALWHFVLNKLDAGTATGELHATFETAGTITEAGRIISDNGQTQVQHFDVIIDSGDALLEAYASVGAQTGETGNGPMLLLSHICDGGSASSPSPSESASVSPSESASVSPSESASVEPDRDVTVMVMKHNCENVMAEGEFEAVEARTATNPTTPDAAFGPTVETVLECPTVVLEGDAQTPGAVAGGTSAFDFTVADGEGSQTLSTDGDFNQVGACETDVAYDANRDGDLDADVCLDLSHYGFDVEDGAVTVTETEAPEGFSFGALRFTPGSGDDAALISAEAGVIVLDTTADSDGMVMLHVYNFADESASESPSESASPSPSESASVSPRDDVAGGNLTPKPGEGSLPNTATEEPASPLVPLLALIAFASLGLLARRSFASVNTRR